MGRAQFGTEDRRARHTLEQAIRDTPRFLPAWQYLVRLLTVSRSPDAPAWADRLAAAFPDCYPALIPAALAHGPPAAIERLTRLLDLVTPGNRPHALAAFRPAILSAASQAPFDPSVVALLRRACAVFPESARLADELASALLRTGDVAAAFAEQARALTQRQVATAFRDEYPTPGRVPPAWLFADAVIRPARAAPSPPTEIESLRQEAYRRYQSDDRSGAASLCRRILDADPRHPEAHYLSGVLAQDEGRLPEAAAAIAKAAELVPDNAVFANALGEVLNGLGRQDDALDRFRRTLELRPTYDRAHNNLGLILHARKDLDAARSHFAEAVRLNPNYAIAHNNLGAVYQAESKPEIAAEHFRRALTVRPNYPEAHFNLGAAMQALGDPVAAIGCFAEAIRLRPEYGRAHFQLGQALEQLRRDQDALACYQTAARLRPDDPEVHQRLGDMLLLKQDYPAAGVAFERAVALAPNDPAPFARLVNFRQQACDWRTYDEDVDRLADDADRQIAADESTSVVPFQALSLPWSSARLLAVARSHSRALERRSKPISARPPTRSDRIRIGYLSGDFYDHPIGHLLLGHFGRHDRSRFETFVYSISPPDDSVYRRRIERESEHFANVAPLSTDDLAARIAADGIEILVDLMGYTGFHRFGVFARRPAAIQVSFLGMLGTTGADFIDYLIADSIVAPFELAPWFTEKFVAMPDCYLIAEPESTFPTGHVRRADHGLPETGFVFASFNSAYKLEPVLFAAWMRILAAVPDCILWLHAAAPMVADNLRREAAGHGVDPQRLVFASLVPRPQHLARHRAADLFLDTRLYGAAATASLALQAGVPLLTCLGETFASRVGASLVRTVGLPELVAADLAAYERTAIELATQPERLRSLRERLEANRVATPLFDVPRFVANLERAYEHMRRVRDRGAGPDAFLVVSQRIAGTRLA